MSVLDPSIAGQLTEGLPRADFLRIIGTFQQDLGRLTQELAHAAASGDSPAFHRAAHSLAGAAGAVGALALEASARLGMAPPQGRALPPAAPTAALAERIRTDAAAALAALAALVHGPG